MYKKHKLGYQKMETISIKNLLSFTLMSYFLMACNAPAYISGSLEGIESNNLKIYLIQPENLQEVAASYFGKVVDSAVVNPDGSFEFVNPPKTKEPLLLQLALQEREKFANYFQTDNPTISNYMPIFWQFGEALKITSTRNGFQKDFYIENPSKTNKSLLNLRDINLKAYQTHLEGKHWQVEKGNELMAKEHAILQYQKALINFADSTQNLMSSLTALRWVSPENDYERVPEFLVRQCNKWKRKQPGHPWVKQLCKQSEPAKLPVLIGDAFPNIKLPLLTKDTVFIKNVLGKRLTIIDLWASWCGPCRIENRDVLGPIWEAYRNSGLQIIAYGLESDESTWRAAAKRDGADRWLQASDLQGDDADFLKNIRIRTIPANFILDGNGVVVAKNIYGKALSKWIKNYFEQLSRF